MPSALTHYSHTACGDLHGAPLPASFPFQSRAQIAGIDRECSRLRQLRSSSLLLLVLITQSYLLAPGIGDCQTVPECPSLVLLKLNGLSRLE